MAGDRAGTPRRTREKQQLDALAAVPCPADRAARVSAIAHRRLTLSKALAKLRRDAVIEALCNGWSVPDLAEVMKVDPSRVHQLKRPLAASNA